jgi:hypothetical protein
MSLLPEWVLGILWLAIAAVGGAIAFYALAAWRRDRSRSMLALGSGFLLLSIGAATAWFLAWMLRVDYGSTLALTCSTTLAGFLVIFYSLRTRLG